MSIQEKIQGQIADAMRSKNQLRLDVLRMMKSAVKLKEVEKMKALEENEVIAVLNTLVKQRKDSIEQFRKGRREELAQKEEAEIKVIEEYLPVAASEEEIRRAVAEAVQERGAASMNDIRKVTKAALAALTGKSAGGPRQPSGKGNVIFMT